MDQACRELGVPQGASEADIKSAYRKLVLQYHPDRHVSSSPEDAAAAAHRFKAVTEAYDFLTDPNGRARSSYGASTSAASTSSSRAYHYNVNTDWSHYESGSAGYTSRISRWEWWRRAARQGARSLGHTLHLSLAVLLVGGGLMFEASHSALWAARNRGKSFEDVQEAVRARKAAAAGGDTKDGQAADSNHVQQQQQEQQQEPVYHLRSAWADSMRGTFVSASPDDPHGPATGSIPTDASTSHTTSTAKQPPGS